MQCKSKEDKKAILEAKAELGKNGFKKVFVRSSQSHEERVMRQNALTLLQYLPKGNELRITQSGRLVKKEEGWVDRREKFAQQHRQDASGSTHQQGHQEGN